MINTAGCFNRIKQKSFLEAVAFYFTVHFVISVKMHIFAM